MSVPHSDSVVEELIQVIVRRAHPCSLESFDGFFGKFAYVNCAATQGFEALIFRIFMLSDKVSGSASVTGDCNRLTLCDLFVAAKVFGKFGCGYFNHGNPVSYTIYVYYSSYGFGQGVSWALISKVSLPMGFHLRPLAEP